MLSAKANRSLACCAAGAGDEPLLEIAAVFNPLSRGAAKLAPMLAMLRDALQPLSVKLYLNPAAELSDMPLNSYFR